MQIDWKKFSTIRKVGWELNITERDYYKNYYKYNGLGRRIEKRPSTFFLANQREIYFSPAIFKILLFITKFDDHMTSFLIHKVDGAFFQKPWRHMIIQMFWYQCNAEYSFCTYPFYLHQEVYSCTSSVAKILRICNKKASGTYEFIF